MVRLDDACRRHLQDQQKLLNAQFKNKLPWADNPEIIDLTVHRSERYHALKAEGVPSVGDAPGFFSGLHHTPAMCSP